MNKYSFVVAGLVMILVIIILMRIGDVKNSYGQQGKDWFCIFFADKCMISFNANLGVYDPQGDFDNLNSQAIQHIYIQYNTFDRNLLIGELNRIRNRDRWAMVTVEPYPLDESRRNQLLEDSVDGQFDSLINDICTTFNEGIDTPVLIRWGHEMENVTGRYRWAVDNGALYIEAYKKFVEKCRNVYDSGFYVWSPVGNKELNEYWPGGDYADYVGLSVYGLPEFDIKYYGKMRSMEENLKEKVDRVLGFGKPIMITELGVNGDKYFQNQWIKEGFKAMDKYPQVKTLVYFNSKDNEGAWDAGFGIPDWKIDPTVWEKVK